MRFWLCLCNNRDCCERMGFQDEFGYLFYLSSYRKYSLKQKGESLWFSHSYVTIVFRLFNLTKSRQEDDYKQRKKEKNECGVREQPKALFIATNKYFFHQPNHGVHIPFVTFAH